MDEEILDFDPTTDAGIVFKLKKTPWSHNTKSLRPSRTYQHLSNIGSNYFITAGRCDEQGVLVCLLYKKDELRDDIEIDGTSIQIFGETYIVLNYGYKRLQDKYIDEITRIDSKEFIDNLIRVYKVNKKKKVKLKNLLKNPSNAEISKYTNDESVNTDTLGNVYRLKNIDTDIIVNSINRNSYKSLSLLCDFHPDIIVSLGRNIENKIICAMAYKKNILDAKVNEYEIIFHNEEYILQNYSYVMLDEIYLEKIDNIDITDIICNLIENLSEKTYMRIANREGDSYNFFNSLEYKKQGIEKISNEENDEYKGLVFDLKDVNLYELLESKYNIYTYKYLKKRKLNLFLSLGKIDDCVLVTSLYENNFINYSNSTSFLYNDKLYKINNENLFLIKIELINPLEVVDISNLLESLSIYYREKKYNQLMICKKNAIIDYKIANSNEWSLHQLNYFKPDYLLVTSYIGENNYKCIFLFSRKMKYCTAVQINDNQYYASYEYIVTAK